jgi:hypothetical protein
LALLILAVLGMLWMAGAFTDESDMPINSGMTVGSAAIVEEVDRVV